MDTDEYMENLSNMAGLDIYLASLSKEEYEKIRHRIKTSKYQPHPIMSWDISGQFQNNADNNNKESDTLKLRQLAKKHQWNIDIGKLLDTSYQAIVVTDTDLIISWVNKGFKEMTGYSTKFAIGKTPKFLQGIDTSEITRKKIREHLSLLQPFTGVITNYRKNRDAYLCMVNIYPVQNQQNQVTHFIALEKEVA